MKILQDSGVKHWALLEKPRCVICTTVFQAETLSDFSSWIRADYVWMTCPSCGAEQKVFKSVPNGIAPANTPFEDW